MEEGCLLDWGKGGAKGPSTVDCANVSCSGVNKVEAETIKNRNHSSEIRGLRDIRVCTNVILEDKFASHPPAAGLKYGNTCISDEVKVFVTHTQDNIKLSQEVDNSGSSPCGSEPLVGGRHVKIPKRKRPKGAGEFKRGSIKSVVKDETDVAQSSSIGEDNRVDLRKFEVVYSRRKKEKN